MLNKHAVVSLCLLCAFVGTSTAASTERNLLKEVPHVAGQDVTDEINSVSQKAFVQWNAKVDDWSRSIKLFAQLIEALGGLVTMLPDKAAESLANNDLDDFQARFPMTANVTAKSRKIVESFIKKLKKGLEINFTNGLFDSIAAAAAGSKAKKADIKRTEAAANARVKKIVRSYVTQLSKSMCEIERTIQVIMFGPSSNSSVAAKTGFCAKENVNPWAVAMNSKTSVPVAARARAQILSSFESRFRFKALGTPAAVHLAWLQDVIGSQKLSATLVSKLAALPSLRSKFIAVAQYYMQQAQQRIAKLKSLYVEQLNTFARELKIVVQRAEF